MPSLNVLSVASEVYPPSKTGGLADVAAPLPAALEPEGVRVRTFMPGYPAVPAALNGGEVVAEPPGLGGEARLIAGQVRGLVLYAIDAVCSRAGHLCGIRKGIDETVWDPGRDPTVPSAYGAASSDGRTANLYRNLVASLESTTASAGAPA